MEAAIRSHSIVRRPNVRWPNGRWYWAIVRCFAVAALGAAIVGVAVAPARADLDSAREAAQRGDHETAFRELTPLADAGDIDAQYYLGGLYYKGEGVEQDYAKAVDWFSKSADRGNAKAQTDLAQCYLFGYGVEKDAAEAVRWYRRAAAQGYAPAALNLAALISSGTGTEKNLQRAHMWATIAMSKFDGEDYQSAVSIRTSAARLLPPDLLKEAHRLVREWRPAEEN